MKRHPITQRWLPVQVIILSWFFCGSLYASDDSKGVSQETSTYSSVMENVDRKHLHLSRKVVRLATGLDSYFSGNSITETENKSYVKLRLESYFEEGGDTDTRLRIKGKLDLPNTQKKIRVFFDSRADSTRDLSTKAVPSSPARNSDTEVGLEYEKGRKNWTTSTSVGMKPKLPFNPVFKYRVGRGIAVGDVWSSHFDQQLWYDHEKGWGEESALSFERAVAEDYVFRILSDLQFQDRYNAFEWAEIISLFKPLDEKSSVQYSIGAFANSRPEWKSTRYILMLEYRKDIHKGWLFMNVSPLLNFERQDDFEPKLSLTINLVAVFSDF